MKMREIEIEVTGTTPLLMNSPKAMLDPEKPSRKTTKKYDPKEEAEKLTYRNEKGKLYVPSVAVKNSIINAASWKKSGKYAAKAILAAGIRIPEQEIVLDNQKYEIHTTTVVIQRSRVLKWRPMIKDWKLAFKIGYNADLIADPELIKECLAEAGERVGLLDWRPQKLGEFGCFRITKWKVIENGA